MPESSSRHSYIAVFLILLVAAGMTYYHLGLFIPHAIEQRVARGVGRGYSFGDDFYPIWLTSHEALFHRRNPYTPEMTRDIQIGLFGRPLDPKTPGNPPADYRTFAYPAYVDLIFWPLSLFSFPSVRILLAALFALLTALSIPLWLRAIRLRASPPLLAILILLSLSSYAVIEGLFAVQLGLVVGFLLAASFAALVSSRFFLAGTLFAFTFIKPQMSIVVAAYLLLWSFSDWQVRRKFVYGLLVWSALFVAASFAVWPYWIPQWLGVLSGYSGYSHPPLITFSLGPSLGPKLGPPLIVGLLAAALILMWKMRRVSSQSHVFLLTVSLLLALTSITLLPGQAVHDHVMLLPGILMAVWTGRKIAASNRAFAIVLVAGAIALFWQWIIAIPLLGLRFFLSPAVFYSKGIWLLPFHTAASVPLAVTAVTGYMMARALHEKRLDERSDVGLTA